MTEMVTLLADPPWRFGDKLPGPSRGAEKNYATMTALDLQRVMLPPIAGNARLFLWRVASMQEEALAVMRAWGFVPKAEIVWVKKTSTGKRWFGMGRTVRMEHEVCLVGARGRPPILSKSVRSVFEAPYTLHSGKPDVFYEIVESLSPGPYCELFARRPRAGWVSFGHELGSTLEVAK